jgi:hypothetical protein
MVSVLAGCDPEYAIGGTVQQAGHPVASASVWVDCEGRQSRAGVLSDLEGRFLVWELGCLERSCTINVKAWDDEPHVYNWSEGDCRSRHYFLGCNGCSRLEADFDLGR